MGVAQSNSNQKRLTGTCTVNNNRNVFKYNSYDGAQEIICDASGRGPPIWKNNSVREKFGSHMNNNYKHQNNNSERCIYVLIFLIVLIFFYYAYSSRY